MTTGPENYEKNARMIFEINLTEKKMDLTQATDQDLVKLLIKGSSDALNEVMERYEEKVFNLAMRHTRNQQDAEEVLQDVFTTVYRKIKSFQGKAAFSSWLYRITVNAAFMKLRKRKQEQAIPMEDMSGPIEAKFMQDHDAFDTTSYSEASNAELRDVLQKAVDRLPYEYRSVFVLRDVDGLSNKECASILKLSIPAIKSRLHRARLMLRKKLERYYADYLKPTQIVCYGPTYLNGTV